MSEHDDDTLDLRDSWPPPPDARTTDPRVLDDDARLVLAVERLNTGLRDLERIIEASVRASKRLAETMGRLLVRLGDKPPIQAADREHPMAPQCPATMSLGTTTYRCDRKAGHPDGHEAASGPRWQA